MADAAADRRRAGRAALRVPDAYAKWEKPADDLVAAITSPGGILVACGSDLSGDGWTPPVTGPITSGFRTTDRPTHDGVDIGVPEGTPIHAASAGTVTAVGCNAHTASGTAVSCDTDGNRSLVGLGWYVTIAHPDKITTTYGHQLEHPPVDVGQHVDAGDIIGVSGSSGDSSGTAPPLQDHPAVRAHRPGAVHGRARRTPDLTPPEHTDRRDPAMAG